MGGIKLLPVFVAKSNADFGEFVGILFIIWKQRNYGTRHFMQQLSCHL